MNEIKMVRIKEKKTDESIQYYIVGTFIQSVSANIKHLDEKLSMEI